MIIMLSVLYMEAPGGLPYKKDGGYSWEILKRTLKKYRDHAPKRVPMLKQHIVFCYVFSAKYHKMYCQKLSLLNV